MKTFLVTSILITELVNAETCYPKLPVCQPNASCCAGIPECDWIKVVTANPHAENSEWFNPCAALIAPTCMISMEGHLISTGPDLHCVTSNSLSWQWPAEHSCVDGFVLPAGSSILIDLDKTEEVLPCKRYSLSVGDSAADICTAIGSENYPLVYSKSDDASFVVDRDIAIKRGSVWRISAEPDCQMLQATATFEVALQAILTEAGTSGTSEQSSTTAAVKEPDTPQQGPSTAPPPIIDASSAAISYTLPAVSLTLLFYYMN